MHFKSYVINVFKSIFLYKLQVEKYALKIVLIDMLACHCQRLIRWLFSIYCFFM